MRESLKPIEAGCIAWVVPWNAWFGSGGGYIVNVVRRSTLSVDSCVRCGRTDRYWECNPIPPGKGNHCECVLIRIDGDPDAEARETEREVGTSQ